MRLNIPGLENKTAGDQRRSPRESRGGIAHGFVQVAEKYIVKTDTIFYFCLELVNRLWRNLYFIEPL